MKTQELDKKIEELKTFQNQLNEMKNYLEVLKQSATYFKLETKHSGIYVGCNRELLELISTTIKKYATDKIEEITLDLTKL